MLRCSPRYPVAASCQPSGRIARGCQSALTKRYSSQCAPLTPNDVAALLAKPTWSVATLFDKSSVSSQKDIGAKDLHHLLRLSALPAPMTTAEENEMLATLSTQLHFVREIQQAPTENVTPLRNLLDESCEGQKEAEISMTTLRAALSREQVKGKHHKRIRRLSQQASENVSTADMPDGLHWKPLDTAARKVGRYFTVDGGK